MELFPKGLVHRFSQKLAIFDQNKGKRLLKMIILGLYYQKCFFATKIIIKHQFLWYFQEE